MFEPETENDKTEERSRTRLILGVGAVVALALAVLVILFASMKQRQESPFLGNAVRASHQDFEANKAKVTIDNQEVLAQGNLVGMVQFTIQAEINNRSDRTLTGVEVLALVYDLQDKVIAQKIGQPIPRQNPAPLKPGEKRRFAIKIDAPAKYTENDVKQVKVELHGLQFQ